MYLYFKICPVICISGISQSPATPRFLTRSFWFCVSNAEPTNPRYETKVSGNNILTFDTASRYKLFLFVAQDTLY